MGGKVYQEGCDGVTNMNEYGVTELGVDASPV
jgi:hypothetical protein